jgi:hypothetical protein
VVYSLVNTPTLIRDLARLPAGAALAADLLQAFALTPPDLDVVEARARRQPGDSAARRAALMRADTGRVRAHAVLAAVRSEADSHGLASYRGSVDLLATATIGGLDDIVRFLRHEVLADAWARTGDLAVVTHPAALDAVTDGVVATYAGRADIGRAWRHWCAVHPAASLPLGYPLVVDLVRRIDPAAQRPVVPADWALHVHEACWAVHLAGRERAAAVAQLAALRALFAVTAPAAPGHALVATVVAAVHASVGSDLLAPDVYDALMQPFFSLLP